MLIDISTLLAVTILCLGVVGALGFETGLVFPAGGFAEPPLLVLVEPVFSVENICLNYLVRSKSIVPRQWCMSS